uniref:ERI1 exoribonuclease 3 n=1 Tax=Ascaris suum TaxID=6253 RepID=F1LAV5_ASCSU
MRLALPRFVRIASDIQTVKQPKTLRCNLLMESRRSVSNKRGRHNENTGRRDPRPATRSHVSTQQYFDYFLVLDFEATCEQNAKIQPVQEIIEFPVVQFCTKTLQEVARFHEYVHPTERPVLTSFCTNLTGIVQEMVDNQMILPDVLAKFRRWLSQQCLIDAESGDRVRNSWTFVTCGDWDLGTILPQEASFRGLHLPPYFGSWINLKKAYRNAKGYFPNSLMVMLNDLQIPHTGRLHSGIDDVINICAIVRKLCEDGYLLENTSYLTNNVVSGQRAPLFGWRPRTGQFGTS